MKGSVEKSNIKVIFMPLQINTSTVEGKEKAHKGRQRYVHHAYPVHTVAAADSEMAPLGLKQHRMAQKSNT